MHFDNKFLRINLRRLPDITEIIRNKIKVPQRSLFYPQYDMLQRINAIDLILKVKADVAACTGTKRTTEIPNFSIMRIFAMDLLRSV